MRPAGHRRTLVYFTSPVANGWAWGRVYSYSPTETILFEVGDMAGYAEEVRTGDYFFAWANPRAERPGDLALGSWERAPAPVPEEEP